MCFRYLVEIFEGFETDEDTVGPSLMADTCLSYLLFIYIYIYTHIYVCVCVYRL